MTKKNQKTIKDIFGNVYGEWYWTIKRKEEK